MRLSGVGTIAKGAPADLIVFKARGWSEFLSRNQADRAVIRGGKAIDTTPPDFAELDAVVGSA
jgi:cytosine deaminase